MMLCTSMKYLVGQVSCSRRTAVEKRLARGGISQLSRSRFNVVEATVV
jgi:hypothetical protein